MFSKDEVKKELEKALEIFKERLGRVHTGQATPALVEDIKVMYQGYEARLKELASLRNEGPRTLVIEPWDKRSVGDIERGIVSARNTLNPQVKGNAIYLTFPSLTQEIRQSLVKEVKEMKEEARVKVRRIRDEWWENIQRAQKDGEIGEDDKFRFKDDLQKMVDEHNTKIEEMTERKIKLLE